MAASTFIPVKAFHPGVTLAEKLKEMDMGVKEFALRTSKPEKTIHAVIKGGSSITSDMAVAFESVTNIPAHFWLSKQRNYDEYLARIRREATLEDACEWAKVFPYADMVKLGWIKPCNTIEEKAMALLSYFQISTAKAWEDYYINQKLKIAFRISLAGTKEPHALSAWLRQGELKANSLNVPVYSESRLRKNIELLKDLMKEDADDVESKAKEICAEAGVKLIYTPSLPNSVVSGSTRWINGYPCIQLSENGIDRDDYWFTLFHEIGHVLLHGKKDIFLEQETQTEEERRKEEEANAFASTILSKTEISK